MFRNAFFILLLLAGPPGAGTAGADPAKQAPLFDSHEVLDVTIPLHFKDLCRPREDEKCDFTATTLNYLDAGGDSVELPVEVKVRGGWRSLTQNCSAPLLWIRFDDVQTPGTLFAGQAMLPLTTHCGQGFSLEAIKTRPPKSDWEQYLLKEYLAHRIYELFTEFSLRTRLVRIHYPDPDRPSRIVHNYAFFTEHFDSMAARNDSVRLDRGSFDYIRLDNGTADVLALFQYMIGNTDWSIVRQRNTILLQKQDGTQVPAPYDFDMSGLVNAHYAGPPPGLPIDCVQDRYYLGFCHPDPHWEELFEQFKSQQDRVFDLLSETPGLDSDTLESSEKFLQGFFRKLDSESARKKSIVNACKSWPPSEIDHTTPPEKRK